MIVIVVHKAQLGHGAGALRPSVDRVKHAGAGGAAVLRIERQDQDAAKTLCFQRLQLAGNARVAIAHTEHHAHAMAALREAALQEQRVFLAPDFERRAAALAV